MERGHQRFKKMNEKEGGGLGGKAPQKPEHFDARKGNGNHICDTPTPPAPYEFLNEILTPPLPHLG